MCVEASGLGEEVEQLATLYLRMCDDEVRTRHRGAAHWGPAFWASLVDPVRNWFTTKIEKIGEALGLVPIKNEPCLLGAVVPVDRAGGQAFATDVGSPDVVRRRLKGRPPPGPPRGLVNASARRVVWPVARLRAPWAMSAASLAKSRMRARTAKVVSTWQPSCTSPPARARREPQFPSPCASTILEVAQIVGASCSPVPAAGALSQLMPFAV